MKYKEEVALEILKSESLFKVLIYKTFNGIK